MSKKSKKAKKLLKAQKRAGVQNPNSTPFLDRYKPQRWVSEDLAASTCSIAAATCALADSTCSLSTDTLSPDAYRLPLNVFPGVGEQEREPECEPDPYPSEYWHVLTALALVAFVVVSALTGLLMTLWS